MVNAGLMLLLSGSFICCIVFAGANSSSAMDVEENGILFMMVVA